ncbi:hypothetical protein ACU61A_12550 [Pseudonocardia sichuanensis]
MRSTRPPRLEHKATALTGPVAARSTGPDGAAASIWEGLIAITGVPHGDVVFAPGAIGRAFARRRPKGTHGKDWLRPVAIMEASEELMPSDPRLPATLPDGSLWPAEAGAVWARLRFITGTIDGKAALAAAQCTPPGGWLLGFKAERERKRAGIRVLDELDVYQLWPRSLRGDRPGGPEVKSAVGDMEVKAAGPPRSQHTARTRPGLPTVVPCSICRRPAAALVNGGLRAMDERLICSSCVAVIHDALDQHLGTIGPDELAETEELTSEDEYAAALDEQRQWHLDADGYLLDGPPDEWAPRRR